MSQIGSLSQSPLGRRKTCSHLRRPGDAICSLATATQGIGEWQQNFGNTWQKLPIKIQQTQESLQFLDICGGKSTTTAST
jgi:hypothetical protein